MSADTSRSFFEWKERFFPELSRKEKYESLEENVERLAAVLANDTFNHLNVKTTDKNLTKRPSRRANARR